MKNASELSPGRLYREDCMSNIIVSIIVPVFKVEETLLRRCIESLMGQTLTAIEILLVDDGCPAGGGAICDEYAGKDSRIRVIHQSNKGISGARNAGLDAACGKYITFVDGDDFISPELCMELFTAAEKTGADIAACGADRYDIVYEACLPYIPGCSVLYREKEDICQLSLAILRTMKFNRRKLYLRINNYVWAHLYRVQWLKDLRFDTRLSGGEDRLFNFMAMERCTCFCSIDRVLYHYTINPHSVTHIFRPSAPELALDTYQLYRELPMVRNSVEYRNAYYIRTCCMALAMVRSYYCHPDNPHKSLRKEFRAFCEIPLVAEAIRRASLRSMRLCKMKFCIYALKWRLYGIAARFALFWNL